MGLRLFAGYGGIRARARAARRGHLAALVVSLGVLSGCATTSTGGDAVQFEPMPVAIYGEDELGPIERQSLRQTLNRAQNALTAANRAHEDGDEANALQQYTLMLEILAEADLDPAIFYSLRNEFTSIIDTSTIQARVYERDPTLTWREEVTHLPSVSGLQYPTPLPDRVLSELESILEVYPKNFEYGLARAARYQPYIRDAFVEAGLPEDLMWLAMVESQYTPRIVSRAGAGGMWQFMRSTGRHYGLNTNYYVDDRFDWKKSTHAAIAYLKELHRIFDGEWPLAVSAYNMGEGGLERAIASNGGDRNLWTLIEQPPAANRIRLETKKFYSKLLASAIVGKQPERYGLNPKYQAPDDTLVIEVNGAYLLRDIERASGLGQNDLARLNQHLIRSMTSPYETVNLYVPRAHRDAVRGALKELPKLRPDTHVVQRGETPGGIAKLYDVPVSELMRINDIRSARSLQIGQRLVVPGRVGATSPASPSGGDGPAVYTVRRGDSLSKIADRYRVSVSDLQAWNRLGRSTRIHVGDRVHVSAPSTASAPNSTSKQRSTPSAEVVSVTHSVKPGESAGVIAQRYGVRTSQLLEWNGLGKNAVLQIGQKLTVRVPAAQDAANTTNGDADTEGDITLHTVRRGENPSSIAQKYGVTLRDLYSWNGWEKTPVLQIGQQVTVQRD